MVNLSSPRPWGCFSPDLRYIVIGGVFPTPVGVFPYRNLTCLPCIGLPHARGGVSYGKQQARDGKKSSPRPWGCFSLPRSLRSNLLVFPTPVGVFPKTACKSPSITSLPHARGGVSS